MTTCSFLPAATQMIYDMGLDHLLHGVTFECPVPAYDNKSKVVRCVLEGKEYSSLEIDHIFSASKAQGKSLYYVDETLLQHIQPDVIFTQDLCEVCQIDTACTAAAVSRLSKPPLVVPLSPSGLQDVFNSAVIIARALGHEEAANTYLASLQTRMHAIIDELRKERALPKRVMLIEWIELVYNCGHWIPHQIAYAGGIDMLGNPSGYSIVTPWEKIVKYDPEVLIIAPCGFKVERAKEEMPLLTEKEGWNTLSAVRNNAVHMIDFDLFTMPCPSTLVDGIEVLAALFHPSLFTVPAQLAHKYASFQTRDRYVQA